MTRADQPGVRDPDPACADKWGTRGRFNPVAGKLARSSAARAERSLVHAHVDCENGA
jgi:hypothetical protein